MFQMLMYALRSFFQRKLFRDGHVALKQWLKGFVLTLMLMLVFGYLFTPLVGVVVASAIGGAVTPYLFRDIKFA